MTTLTTQALGATTTHGSSPGPRAGPFARLLVFLRTELAPSSARTRATWRIVIACLVAITLAMTFRIPNVHWLIVTIFIVSQPNVGASIDRAILRLAGTVVGATGVILTVVAFPQQPWFALPLIALLIGASAFLSRTTSYPYVALLGGITIVLFLGSAVEHPMLSVTDGLWRLGVIALAEVIATSAQLLLWPDDPEKLLLDDFARILQAVEARLGRLVDREAGAASEAETTRLRDGVFNGLARQLDLLGNAETRHRSLRSRHTEQLVLIGAVNRVASASLTFETLLDGSSGRLRAADPNDPLHARIRAIRERTATMRRAITERRSPAVDELDRTAVAADAVPRDRYVLAPLVDMERALDEMPPAMAFLDRSVRDAAAGTAELPWTPLESNEGRHFLTPACSWSNTRDLRFAAQVTIAAMICYLLVAGLRWPDISTAVVTCVIVGQSSFGATVQKALLRLAGATVGGLLGLAAIVLVVPNIDSLPPFLIVVGVCSAVAAYVTTGSARISYVGIQIALAFAMALVDTYGPSIELVRPRDRVIGILLGNVVLAAVMFWAWPVLAGKEMVRSLESALRHMAALSRFGLSGAGGGNIERPVRGFRAQIFTDLATTLRLHGEAQFEPGAATAEHQAQQHRLLALLQEAQQAFLLVAGFVRNRLNEALGQIDLPARAAMHEIALGVGANLEAAADQLAGRPVRAAPSMPALVAAAEASLASDAAASTDLPRAAQALTVLRGQLELYRSLAPLLERLATHARAVRDGAAAG